MKINNLPGESAFKALYRKKGKTYWSITENFFFTFNEVTEHFEDSVADFKWPVELWEDGSLYIPSEAELEQ